GLLLRLRRVASGPVLASPILRRRALAGRAFGGDRRLGLVRLGLTAEIRVRDVDPRAVTVAVAVGRRRLGRLLLSPPAAARASARLLLRGRRAPVSVWSRFSLGLNGLGLDGLGLDGLGVVLLRLLRGLLFCLDGLLNRL